MKIRSLPVLSLVLALVAAIALGQQVLERIPEANFERATELDADGLKQFAAFDQRCDPCQGLRIDTCQHCAGRDLPDCVECKGQKRSTCRNCTGNSKLLDPLLELACPYCKGSALYPCAQCNGVGYFYENRADGTQIEVSCGACKKVACFPCTVCDGKRRLDTIRIKRKPPTEASLTDLRAMRVELAAIMEELQPFEPLDRAARTTKALEKMLARPGRTLPPLKDMLGLLEVVQKGLVRAGSGYKNFEERQDHQFRVFRDRSVYLLRHQLRTLDLCIERAEFNEKVEKAK